MPLFDSNPLVNCQTFVIRIWQDAHAETWRATLQDVQDGKQQHFVSFAALIEFMQAETDRKENTT